MTGLRGSRLTLQQLLTCSRAFSETQQHSRAFTSLTLGSWRSATTSPAAASAAALGWQRVAALVPSLADAQWLAAPKHKASPAALPQESCAVVCRLPCFHPYASSASVHRQTVPCLIRRCRRTARASAAPTSSSALCRWWRSAASASACSSSTRCPRSARRRTAQPSPCGRGQRPSATASPGHHGMHARQRHSLLCERVEGCKRQKRSDIRNVSRTTKRLAQKEQADSVEWR